MLGTRRTDRNPHTQHTHHLSLTCQYPCGSQDQLLF